MKLNTFLKNSKMIKFMNNAKILNMKSFGQSFIIRKVFSDCIFYTVHFRRDSRRPSMEISAIFGRP